MGNITIIIIKWFDENGFLQSWSCFKLIIIWKLDNDTVHGRPNALYNTLVPHTKLFLHIIFNSSNWGRKIKHCEKWQVSLLLFASKISLILPVNSKFISNWNLNATKIVQNVSNLSQNIKLGVIKSPRTQQKNCTFTQKHLWHNI